jgi:hypothetical protein
MPPKGAGVGLGLKRRNQSVEVSLRQAITTTLGGQGNLSASKTTTNAPERAKFTIAPLVLEGAKMGKLQLNDFIKAHLNEVKVENIQLNRTGTFTLYTADIKSYNKLLNDLTPALDMNSFPGTKLYVPRSIQKIQDTEKVAFVKNVDLEIPEDRILQAMKDTGLEVTSVSRLTTRDGKLPTRTVKVTFSDVANRNTFTRTGLQVDSMHFPAEPATQTVKPTQCNLCLKYNHVAKYCKTKTQACARCGENHSADKCAANAESMKCLNCKGNHLATSTDCQHYKEQENKLRNMVRKYTEHNGHTQAPPALHNRNDFPSLPQAIASQNSLDNLIQLLCNKMEKIIEETTSKILQTMSNKIAKIEKALAIHDNDTEFMSTSTDSEEECKVVEHIRKSQKQQPQQKIKNTTSSINIINTNKKSRPKELFNTAKHPLSPYSSMESVTNTTDDKIINQ